VTGTVKRVYADRGFCFLTVVGGGDAFAHVKDFHGEWPPCVGAAVVFDVSQTERGPRASHVRPVSPIAKNGVADP